MPLRRLAEHLAAAQCRDVFAFDDDRDSQIGELQRAADSLWAELSSEALMKFLLDSEICWTSARGLVDKLTKRIPPVPERQSLRLTACRRQAQRQACSFVELLRVFPHKLGASKCRINGRVHAEMASIIRVGQCRLFAPTGQKGETADSHDCCYRKLLVE